MSVVCAVDVYCIHSLFKYHCVLYVYLYGLLTPIAMNCTYEYDGTVYVYIHIIETGITVSYATYVIA